MRAAAMSTSATRGRRGQAKVVAVRQRALQAGAQLLLRLWNDPRWAHRAALTLTLLALLALLWGGGHWIARQPLFVMQQVLVEALPGQTLRHLSAESFAFTLRRQRMGSFFALDLEAVRAQVEQVDWVRRAQVRRVWPNTLQLVVEEHQPMATWNADRLINDHGELFTANVAEAEVNGALPQLIGPEGSQEKVLARWRDLRSWLAPAERTPVMVSLSASHAWQARLDDGTLLLLGRDEGLGMDHRVARWVASHRSVGERLARPVAAVDLRYPNGFALQLAAVDSSQGGVRKSARRDR